MIEVIMHALGLCGESHANMWSVLIEFPNLQPIINFFKFKTNRK
jgi:hypothetical protein